jgi:triacylglycerol lipase
MIQNMTFAEQSALFAKLSNQAYSAPKEAKKLFKKHGFTNTTYHSHKGSDVYVIQNDTDIVVVCRGTEVKQWSDISADASIALYPSRSGTGKVHRGFRTYTDRVWSEVQAELSKATHKTLWLTGHSLGAAMATLMARRCVLQGELPNPTALFTYGSPRVGNRTYINEFNTQLTHHRWVNNGDIVTKIPLPIRFHHCGTMHHIDGKGKISVDYERSWNIFRVLGLASPFGIWKLLFRDAQDHSSVLYVKQLSFWAENEVCDS